MYLILRQIKGSNISAAPLDMQLQSHGLSPWAPLFLQKKERRRRVFYSIITVVSPSHTQDHKQYSWFLFLPTVKPLPLSACSCPSQRCKGWAATSWLPCALQHTGGTFPCSPGMVSEAAERRQLLALINTVPKPRDCSKAIPHFCCDAGQKYCSLDWTQPLNCPILHRPGQRIGNSLGKGLYSRMSSGRTMWKAIFLYKFFWKWV